MSSAAKKALSLAVSLGVLAVIYWRVDAAAIGAVLRSSDRRWLVAGLAVVAPLMLLTAHRLQLLAPAEARLSLGESLSLTLAASVLNLILPAKMGDVVKCYFIAERGRLSGGLALALVVFEKGWDLLSLFAWCAVGLLILPAQQHAWTVAALLATGALLTLVVLGSAHFAHLVFRPLGAVLPARAHPKLDTLREGWAEMQQRTRESPGRVAYIALVSLAIWLAHLLQIWLFTIALRAHVPLAAALGLAPLATLAGLLPLTFAGVGTRDAALIVLFGDYLEPAAGAALGLLATTRYVLPAVAGLPLFHRYLGGGRAPIDVQRPLS